MSEIARRREEKRNALVRLTKSDHERLTKIAQQEGRSISGQIRFFIRKSLSGYGNERQVSA